MKTISGLFLEIIWDPAPVRNFPYGFANLVCGPIIRWKNWDGRGSDMEANQIFPIEGIERILIVCHEQKRCIPYRVAKNHDEDNFDLESSLEVLMISSPNRDDLVFPKGGWEDDETVEEAACREALEEAGVRGIIKGDSLGDWTFRSKSRQESGCLEGGCKVYMFALEVTEELDAWPEQENHDRKWLFIEDAFRMCRYQWMSKALEKFLEVMATEKKHEESQSLVVLHPAQVSEVNDSFVVLNPAPVSEVVTESPIMSTNCLPSLLSQNSTVLESFQCPAQQC